MLLLDSYIDLYSYILKQTMDADVLCRLTCFVKSTEAILNTQNVINNFFKTNTQVVMIVTLTAAVNVTVINNMSS